MNKIIAGIVGLALAVGVMGVSAKALFTSQATASSVEFSTGGADLLIWDGAAFVTEYNPSNLLFTNMYPGFGGTGLDLAHSTKFQTLFLKNNSSAAIGLIVKGKLRDGVTESPAGAWTILKDKGFVKITLASDFGTSTGWKSLSEWNATGFDLPSNPIAQGAQQDYLFYVRVDGSSGNEIAGQSISAVHFDFTGTQAE